MHEQEKLKLLQAENLRLISLLESHGIDWQALEPPRTISDSEESPRLSTEEKIAIFRRLFHGRTDVYPVRWESKTTRKSGYAPACVNEWRTGVCEKPRVKCGDCNNRLLIPLSNAATARWVTECVVLRPHMNYIKTIKSLEPKHALLITS